MEVMERRAAGGYCVADDDVAWKMGRILLRYRPIAPKPMAGGNTTIGGVEQQDASVGRDKRRRGTRRLGGFTGGRRGRKSRKVVAAGDAAGLGETATVGTLPLKSETPESKEGVLSVGLSERSRASKSACFWQERERQEAAGLPAAGVVIAPTPVRVAAALVTVESVTETWGGELCGNIGRDEELRRWLDSDDSPAFVSDSGERVTWSNAAYRRMIVGGSSANNRTSSTKSSSSSSSSSSSYTSSSCSGVMALPDAASEEEVRVALVTRGLLPASTCRFFTCMARVRYSRRRRGKVSFTSPCDVWQLADGCLAWRVDVKAALSLSIIA